MNSVISAAPESGHLAPLFRKPVPEDGAAVHQLIVNCPPLDTNSRYCNLLQCSHFAETSIIAERELKIVGFVSGYFVPKREDTIFIWQIAVDSSARRQGLALQMLLKLLQQPACHNIRYLETTITEKNNASRALFTRLAEQLGVELVHSKFFMRDTHFNGQHEDENLYRMGPYNTSLLSFSN